MKLNVFNTTVDTVTFSYDKLSRDYAESLLSSSDGTLGLEWYIENGKVKKYLFSQKESLEMEQIPKIIMHTDVKEISCFSLGSYKPSCFPFRMKLKDNILDVVLKYIDKTLGDEKVFIQILLRKLRNEDWQYDMREQYHDYVSGIELPTKNKVIKSLQHKVLEFIQDKEEFGYMNPTIEGAEEKCNESGYEVYIRCLVFGGDKVKRDQIVNKVKLGFSVMNYSNSWIMGSPLNKRAFMSDVNLRRFPLIPTQLIMCVSELLPLFSYGDIRQEIETEIIDVIEENRRDNTSSIYNIFPKGEKVIREDDANIEQRINKAFKKLKLISNQKIKVKQTIHGSTIRKVVFALPDGLKLSNLMSKNTIRDIQAEMALSDVCIEQGKEAATASLVIPQDIREDVLLRDCLENEAFQKFIKNAELPFLLGTDSIGDVLFNDLTKIKHLLVVGATGSGKSVCINVLLLTLLFLKSPKQLQMLCIDPKQVELTTYSKYPHVLDVITDNKKATLALMKMVVKMNERYEVFSKKGYKNIQQYNSSEKDILPYIVIVIDELADLIMSYPSVEEPIVMLAQKARAAGIHLIIATQKPVVDVVTTLIKGNIYSRICFLCDGSSSYHVAIDKVPEYQLLGKGDGVIRFEGIQGLVRFQGALISKSDEEEKMIIEQLANKWKGDKFNKENFDLDDMDIEDPEFTALKRIILEKNETKVSVLKSELGIRAEKVTDMMMELVELGWLVKHKSRQKGYELVLTDEQRKKELSLLSPIK